MTRSATDTASAWTPPPRPEWVRRINAEGACVDLRGVVPLDAESLLESAMKNTGLSDFGGHEWIEPFHVFVNSLDDEADLNLMGRLMSRSDVLQFLEARLRVEDTYRKHPEIEAQEIRAPLFITGLERTGTSILHQLLNEIPGNGTVKCWEAMFPCPPPEQANYHADARIEKADRLLRQNFRVTPSYENSYQMGGNLPTECIHFMCLCFISPWLAALGQVQSYLGYCMSRGDALWNDAYRYHMRVLKLLQWKNPRQQWVLKSPAHLAQLPSLFRIYPDARVVWTHRDPVRAFASGLDLMGTLQWVRSDHPLKGGFEHLLDIDAAARLLCRPIEWLESAVIPKDQLCNTRFHDFNVNPVSAVDRIYAFFGMDISLAGREAMANYMHAHPRSRRGHVYEVGCSDDVAHKRKLLKRYSEYFDVPDEA